MLSLLAIFKNKMHQRSSRLAGQALTNQHLPTNNRLATRWQRWCHEPAGLTLAHTLKAAVKQS